MAQVFGSWNWQSGRLATVRRFAVQAILGRSSPTAYSCSLATRVRKAWGPTIAQGIQPLCSLVPGVWPIASGEPTRKLPSGLKAPGQTQQALPVAAEVTAPNSHIGQAISPRPEVELAIRGRPVGPSPSADGSPHDRSVDLPPRTNLARQGRS